LSDVLDSRYTLALILEAALFVNTIPRTIEVVDAGTVYKVVDVVGISAFVLILNVFAMYYPNAIESAITSSDVATFELFSLSCVVAPETSISNPEVPPNADAPDLY